MTSKTLPNDALLAALEITRLAGEEIALDLEDGALLALGAHDVIARLAARHHPAVAETVSALGRLCALLLAGVACRQGVPVEDMLGSMALVLLAGEE